MIRIQEIYEECSDIPRPDWPIDKEDERIFTQDPFGRIGDAWATVLTISLIKENRLTKTLFRRSKFFQSSMTVPVSEFLQLRVCSPSFKESDPRFLSQGKHLALVQEKFDFEAVAQYCQGKIQESAYLDGPERVQAWKENFYVFDPDED